MQKTVSAGEGKPAGQGPAGRRLGGPMRHLPAIAASLLLLAVIAWFDYATGYDTHLFVFYFVPVSIIAWNMGYRASMAMAVLCGIAWYATDCADGHHYATPLVGYWNAAIELASFVIIGLSVSKLRSDLQREKLLNGKLETLLGEVTRLQGLLPICASCKRIRDDRGDWEQIETYIENHSGAQFSHGICPDCAKKLYPGISDG